MTQQFAGFALALGLSSLPFTAHAQWQVDGVALSTAEYNQYIPAIVSDGAGGAIVAWTDFRSDGLTGDIYAQRVDALGFPQWTPDGVALCTAANTQEFPKIVSDGVGGAIVTWSDNRIDSLAGNIYAQRVSATGTPLWTSDGVALCTATNEQFEPTIASDGVGGAIVTWSDFRNGNDADIYVQRVNASGVAQWTPDGVALCTAANTQESRAILSDDAGGAFVSWHDARSGNYDIYVRRVDASGTPQWTPNGVALCTATNEQFEPKIASDGAGGAVVAWDDYRSGVLDIYARRVSATGTPQWTADGVAVCAAAGAQFGPTIVANGAGGAIVSWSDNRNGTGADVYAQRLDDLGMPQWTPDGVALSSAADYQYLTTMVADGAGGAIMTWYDFRSGDVDVYAQRVSVSGTAQWAADGVALCTAVGGQYNPVIASDGAGGAVVAWGDGRSGDGDDIYAQHVDASGEVPTAVARPTRSPWLIVSEVFPNPFAGTASMDIELTAASAVEIEVFDVAGRRVRSMTLRDAVSQRVEFDGRDNANRLLPSGVYFYRVKAAGETVTRKMVIAR